jgi:hypothetical protein
VSFQLVSYELPYFSQVQEFDHSLIVHFTEFTPCRRVQSNWPECLRLMFWQALALPELGLVVCQENCKVVFHEPGYAILRIEGFSFLEGA